VITERLGPIPTMDGVELVRSIGVKGKYDELKALVEDLSGHAIALTQVATWLVHFRDGDVRARDELPSLVDLGGDNERHPFRVPTRPSSGARSSDAWTKVPGPRRSPP
jgi:hypothetical protein